MTVKTEDKNERLDGGVVDYLATIRKALVPLAAAGLAVVLEWAGVELPGDVVDQVATGLVTAIVVWRIPND